MSNSEMWYLRDFSDWRLWRLDHEADQNSPQQMSQPTGFQSLRLLILSLTRRLCPAFQSFLIFQSGT